jgi:hypothetical protein
METPDRRAGSGTAQIAAGQTRYVGLTTLDATEQIVYIPLSFAGVFKNLKIVSNGSPGVGQTYTATLRRTLACTAVTCQIISGFNEASDATHTATFTAGQRYAIKIVSSRDNQYLVVAGI